MLKQLTKRRKKKIFNKGFNYSQDGLGNRLVYHLQGCNFKCKWCSNPEGMSGENKSCRSYTVSEIFDEIISCKPMFFESFDCEKITFEFLPYHEYGKDKWTEEYTMTDAFIAPEVYDEFKTVFESESLVKEELITHQSENFSIYRTTVKNGDYALEKPVSVCIVTSGEGEIIGNDYKKSIKAGDYFLMPAAAAGKFKAAGNLTLVEAVGK